MIRLKLSLVKSAGSPLNSSKTFGNTQFGLKIVVDSIDVGDGFCGNVKVYKIYSILLISNLFTSMFGGGCLLQQKRGSLGWSII
jgi:hypothetical protein